MTEVRVIARAVARKGKQDQLRALLQGMLIPTRAGHSLFFSSWQKTSSATIYTISVNRFAATPPIFFEKEDRIRIGGKL